MATIPTADEPLTKSGDWQNPQPEPVAWMPDEEPSAPLPLSARIRAELWHPRYAILAGIVVLLIVLQIWILF